MANHVYFNIELSLDAGQAELVEKLKNSCKENQGEMQWLTYAVEKLPIYSTPYDEDDWYMWGCNNMGAKWVSCEEWNETTISGHSAWSPVVPLVENLIEYIHQEVGGQPSAKMTYEDEFRNFMGKQYYGCDKDGDEGWYAWEGEYNETDGTALCEQFDDLYPSLNSTEDDFEWHDEHEVDGETIYPYEVMDELADQFWERV